MAPLTTAPLDLILSKEWPPLFCIVLLPMTLLAMPLLAITLLTMALLTMALLRWHCSPSHYLTRSNRSLLQHRRPRGASATSAGEQSHNRVLPY